MNQQMILTNKKPDSDKINLIKRIQIYDLFGAYTYDLKTPETDEEESGKLILLYGSNGTGKTTILNLIFHLLSPEPWGGHRTFVSSVPFSKINILLSSGIQVLASRKASEKFGPYMITVYDENGSKIVDWMWIHSEREKEEQERAYLDYCDALSKLGLTFHYLSDTRRFEGFIRDGKDERYRARLIHERRRRGFIVSEEDEEETDPYSPNYQLIESIAGAFDWFRQKAISATTAGYLSVNAIYQDIIKGIVTLEEEDTKIKAADIIPNLKKELTEIKKRNYDFAKYGLTPELEIDELIKSLDAAESKNASLLKEVLGPYLEGHKARLKDLKELQKVIDDFVSLLGEFYFDKFVTVHLQDGLELSSYKGTELSPSQLSSGEKQLLLLLCHAISARKAGTIFIIDEPEISLNVKWQRELIRALMTCLAGTEFQVILATHSIELLSRYREYVLPLENPLK